MLGCGTLASPASPENFRKGTSKKASSNNGKQHSLPANPAHQWHAGTRDRLTAGRNDDGHDDVGEHHGPTQPTKPTRLWGKVKPTQWGGEVRADGEAVGWLTGEYWNCDSNIHKWSIHEVRRNAASANHDVHRHDQITRIVLDPAPGRAPRRSVSGVASADSSFLEAWGFDLGSRDRQAKPVGTWRPVSQKEHFRSLRSYDHDLAAMTDGFRSLRRAASSASTASANKTTPQQQAMSMSMTSVGDGGLGSTHGSKSCRGWDGGDHAVKREAAKMSLSTFAPAANGSRDDYTFVDNELRPGAVYSRRFRTKGHDSLRNHVPRNVKVEVF